MGVRKDRPGGPPHQKAAAIVVAAGESTRMAGVDKIFAPLAGKPLVSYCLDVLQDSPAIEAIVLVLSPENVDRGWRLVDAEGWTKVKEVCAGGSRRQDSVRNGLDRLPDFQWVIVHDGARPFIDGGLVATGLEKARVTGAAVAAVPVKDTIKSADARDLVEKTLRRDRLWSVQTPQVFRRDLLADAHNRSSTDVTDDAAMVEAIGGKIKIYMGGQLNFKVTIPEDLAMAEALLRTRPPAGQHGGSH